jgi:hypothetical protein
LVFKCAFSVFGYCSTIYGITVCKACQSVSNLENTMLYHLIMKPLTCPGHSRAVWKPSSPKFSRKANLMGLMMGSIVQIWWQRTPIRLRHPFGFDLGTFRPWYGVTQMVTHERGIFRDYWSFFRIFDTLAHCWKQ